MLSFFLDFIAPKKCYGCKKIGAYLCEDCVKKRQLHQPYCYICKKPSNYFKIHDFCKKTAPEFEYIESIFVWTHYRDEVIQKMIKDAKFYKKKDILKDIPYLFETSLKENIPNDIDFIVYAPMHFWRKLKRTYNHSEIFADSLGRMFDISVISAIQKTRYTGQQSKLGKKSRLENLKNSFGIKKKYEKDIHGKSFLLVDDVISSGTTLSEISKLLHWYGAKSVYCLLIASD